MGVTEGLRAWLEGQGWRRGARGLPSSLTPAPDLGTSPGWPPSRPHSHPQFPLREDEAGRFHSFLEGSQKVNEGKARNSTQGDELLGREEPGSGLTAKGAEGESTDGPGADGPRSRGHSLVPQTSPSPRGLRLSQTLSEGGLLCLDRAGDPFPSTVDLPQPGLLGEVWPLWPWLLPRGLL